MDNKALNTTSIHHEIGILKVVHVEVTPQGRTERELTGEELRQWKIDNGYLVDDSKEA